MKDIETRDDIQLLVSLFYEKALHDAVIGNIFKEANFSLEEHIPVMVSFWETILLDVHTYSGNPMLKHIQLNQTIPLKSAHFDRWLAIWEETLNSNFKGSRAEQAIARAGSIAKMMQIKIAGKF